MFNRRVEYAAGFAALAAGLAAIAALSITPRAANATSTYASQTGLACGRCHVNPGGGGPNTSFGKAFAANGHKLPQKTARKTAAGYATAITTSPPTIYIFCAISPTNVGSNRSR